jgi:GH25 family lysozyme M1 (1,4-beta-N-acetylmuramidase)
MQSTEKRPSVLLRILLFLAALVLLCGAALILRGRMQTVSNSAEPESTSTMETESEQTAQTPSLPKNPYDADQFVTVDGAVTYTGGASYAGIDVSAHQGEIDWQAVAADGIDFAILRVGNRGTSDGNLSVDEQFAANLAGARAAGLKIGVYFFSQAISEEEAIEEANFVLAQLDGCALDYPVFFDWEDVAWEARTDGMDSITLTACAKAFCSTIAASGYRAGLYFNQNYGYQEFDLPELQEYTFWLANYADAPDFVYTFDLWQYSAEGQVNGISTVVDRNLSFTDFTEE